MQKKSTLKTMQKLAASSGFSSWKEAQQGIQGVVEVIAGFSRLALAQGVSANTVAIMQKILDERRVENGGLLV